jgi:cytosine/adenosine deaminase-related metal-dependent hydrolase
MAQLLIRNGFVLSLDDQVGDRADCDVLVRDGTIEAIGSDLSASGATVLDATGQIIMPGLVDAHLHTWQTGIRGIAGDWTLFEYGRNMHAGLARAFTPEDIYIANLVGALNQLNCGVTTVFDWCHNNPTPEHSDRAIDGLEEAGIRAVFGHGTPKPKLNEGGVPTDEHLHPRDEVKRLYSERLGAGDGLVSMAMCIRGPDLASLEACQHDIDLAREFDLVASMHIGGRMMFNRRTPNGIEELHGSGHLGPHINIVHGNKLTDREIELLAGAGASFTMTPEVEMQMGHGLPVTGRVRRHGVEPSIGIDVESNIGTDVLQAARFALQVQRGLDNVAVNETGQEVQQTSIQSRKALEWATIAGAKAIGLSDRIGSLRPGKQADIILVRRDELAVCPCYNPAETVLFHAQAANVDTVIVAGKIKKQAGRLLADGLGEKKRLLAQSGEKILQKAGLRTSQSNREELENA